MSDTTDNIPSFPLPHNKDGGSEEADAEKPIKDNAAADLVRQRLAKIYASEPDAKAEQQKISAKQGSYSKHQEFMRNLSMSGKPLAEIQTAWHNYYVSLPDAEKHEVWQEFYAQHSNSPAARQSAPAMHAIDRTTSTPESAAPGRPRKTQPKQSRQTLADAKRRLASKTSAKQRMKARQHAQSLMFGIGLGSLAIFIVLFSFFNERIIAPFIQPSRTVSSTPIIIDPGSDSVSKTPEIIIPKINVEIPVDYNLQSIDDNAVETALESGVIHYPTTVNPGELGNAAFFGHSSNNIFNKGKYKFAFVLLKRLENGDIFYLTKDGKRYTYQVYDKKIVKPEDVTVLGYAGKQATATLITCDPPGTSINRLVVYGVQINPDPAKNTVSKIKTNSATPKELPSNAPSLWSRLVNWFSH